MKERAREFSLGQIAKATSGRIEQGAESLMLDAVATDSRDVETGCLFIGLSGERFDGASFCSDAVKAGAVAVMVNRKAWDEGRCSVPTDCGVVTVGDTLFALGELARWYRNRFSAKVVAVTGSNGKTSTKEMVASVLGGEPTVLANRGNFNNLIGMPRALLRLDSSHRWAVMEMGMNAPGEIARLAQIAGPQIGVVTNVHPVHLEGLGSIQAVASAKGELVESLPADGVAVLNADDPYVLQQAERSRARVLTFGQSPAADIRVEDARQDLDGIRFVLAMDKQRFSVHMPRLGIHNALNAAAAAAVGKIASVAGDLIAQRLESAPSPSMRMEVVKVGATRMILDCYNANPRSVQAAVATVSKLPADGTRLAVIGDMLELGSASEQLHSQVGMTIANSKMDGLCAFGPRSVHLANAARAAGMDDVFHTERIEEVIGWTDDRMEGCCWMLVKGSRGMRMERVLDGLKELGRQVPDQR